MLKHHSALSPDGKPDPLALSLAVEPKHAWTHGEKFARLDVVLETSDLFLCFDGIFLFLHYPRKIFKVPIPAPPR
jgi:hypothetical protein